MSKPREPWNIRPAKKKVVIPASIKSQVEAEAKDLIENVLKPKHVLPPKTDEKFNYISDIHAKWFRNYFYFISTYTCPDPNNAYSTFDSKFARLEYLGNGTFALYFMRYTGEWVGMYDALSIDESMKAIQDDPCFDP
ncbi:DUF3024 domain-containing protein [Novipirellula artificiosorum]|uniref:Uncharacterized protein n=1 Tax=Novipirellula artificiosorum TaxID=2528016 RepID=A0A5C6DSV9_9BACT|nr:hypothetical protein [Novipirellula artificiosorum]TWU39284.1 hypothetical protein Poly41_21080 [Novipirellula artificiosorum]